MTEQRTGKIYLRVDDGLVAMSESTYDAEDVLQRLLADYPDLLAGDQMRPEDPRRWLLVAREAGIPDAFSALPRWSLDHLFIDQDAVPTLVEVKRSQNTQVRREVVGQMLDYAANVVAHWPPTKLRELFEERCRVSGLDPEAQVAYLLDPDGSGEGTVGELVDDFWVRAGDNLAARRLRLVFVADVIPRELQSIVEFLNENLVHTDVLAVEVKQYLGQGRQTLVPRVIGGTAAAAAVKPPTSRAPRVVRSWDDASFLAAVAESGDERVKVLVRDARAWLGRHGCATVYGHGKGGPLYLNAADATGATVRMANVSASGWVMVQYDHLAKASPFDDVAIRLELNRRLNGVPGIRLDDRYARDATWPSFAVETFADDATRAGFFAVLDWAAAQIRGASADAAGASNA